MFTLYIEKNNQSLPTDNQIKTAMGKLKGVTNVRPRPRKSGDTMVFVDYDHDRSSGISSTDVERGLINALNGRSDSWGVTHV